MDIHVVYHAKVEKDLKKLPVHIRKRFFNAVATLKSNPLRGIPLKGDFEGRRKVRLGDYRIVYKFFSAERTVFIFEIESRQGAYKN